MTRFNLRVFVFAFLCFLALLKLISAATMNDALLSPTTTATWQNITSTPQNFTASLTYVTSNSQYSSPITQPISLHSQISDPSTSNSPTTTSALQPSTTISQTPSPTSTGSCICPGEGKACGSRMSGNCNNSTLYSCMNNWDPPLENERKDCSLIDGKKGVCMENKQSFWEKLTGQVNDGCVDA